MASETLVKTWTFDADAEGWTFAPVNGTGAFVASGGNTTGYIYANVSGRNKTDDGSWELTTTFEALGVPSNATVTGYGLCSFYGRCLIYDTVDYARHGDLASTEGALFINDGILRTLIPSQANYTSTTAWAQFSNNPNITGLSLAPTTSIIIHANHDMDLANGPTAQVRIGWDDIAITIAYETPSQTLTDSITLTQSKTSSLDKALIGSRNYTLTSSNIFSNSALMDTLETLSLLNQNNINSLTSLTYLVSQVLTQAYIVDNSSDLISTVLLELSKSYTVSEIVDILYGAGVYLSTTQDSSGVRQRQLIETWSDNEIIWTTVQGELPLDTPLEHAVVTTSGETAWSSFTVILSILQEFNVAILINKSADIALLRYLNTNQNTTVSSEYTIANITGLLQTVLVDLDLSITDQQVSQLITSVLLSIDKVGTLDFTKSLLTSQDINLTNVQEILNFATANYTEELLISKVLSKFTDSEASINVALLFEYLGNYTDATRTISVLRTIALENNISTFIDAQALITYIATLNLSQGHSISYTISNIVNKLTEYNLSVDTNTFSSKIAQVLYELNISVTPEALNDLITNRELNLTNAFTLGVLSDVFGQLYGLLLLNTTITQAQAVSQISNVITTLQQQYSDEVVSTFITNLVISLSSTINIDYYLELVITLLLTLVTQKTFNAIAIAEAIQFISIESTISVESLNILISTVTAELYKHSTIANISYIITEVTTSLVQENYIDLSRNVAKTAITTLLQETNISSLTNLIAQVYNLLALELNTDNNFELQALANISLDTFNVLDTSSIGNYIASVLFDSTATSTIEDTAILNNTINIDSRYVSLFDTLFQNEARINLNYSITTIVTSFANLFAALEVILDKNINLDIAKLIFADTSFSQNLDTNTLNTLSALADISLGYDSSVLETLTRDIQAAIQLTSDNTSPILSTLTLTGQLNIGSEVQDILGSAGILNSEMAVTNAVSLQLLRAAILDAGLEISNTIVVETGYGFDLFIETPTKRILVIRFDNRDFTVTFEDRTKILPSEDRNKIIPGKS